MGIALALKHFSLLCSSIDKENSETYVPAFYCASHCVCKAENTDPSGQQQQNSPFTY